MAENTEKNSDNEANKKPQKTNKERLKEITDSIETGIKDLFDSEKYKRYLKTMSRFHNYSVNNTMLIYLQRPDARQVAGYNAWRDKFGRSVKRGEKGIRIIAPTPFKKKIEQEKIDPYTKLPMLDDNGKVIMEEKEVKIPMFRPVSVFDVSQTYGKPLPELASKLFGDVKNFEMFMEALVRSSPVAISFEDMDENTDGYFDLTHQLIAIRKGMSEVQTVSAAIHEIAHSKLHNNIDNGDKYDCIELLGLKALFSNARVTADMLPKELYCYDLRGSDNDPGEPVSVEKHVMVNHAGSVITAEPLDIPENGYLRIDDEMNFTGDRQSVKEFFETNLPEKSKLSRSTKEIQAESISYAVCSYYGIETGENSFGYIASWSKGKDLTELRDSLETISRTSDELIKDIDGNYADLMKEHEAEISTQEEKEPEPVEAAPMEQKFISNTKDAYLIYQLKDTPENKRLLFMDSAYLEKNGLTVEKGRYEPVYTGTLTKEGSTQPRLDSVYETFNINHPADFKGRSLSVSDIVALKQNDVISCHYVDSFGFLELPDFKVPENYLRSAEISTEDDYGMIDGIINNGEKKPTVAELEERVKAGEAISLTELTEALRREKAKKAERKEDSPVKRPSVLAKLHENTEHQQKSTAQRKISAEREI